MRRREFITLLGGVAAAWPLAARGQQDGRVRRIGFLSLRPQQAWESYLAELRAGLAQAGFVEGQNVKIDFQVANGSFEQMTEAAAELVRRRPEVILAIDAGPIIRAAKAATDTIPIIFASATDPVKFGFVPSLSRPGGNMTGFSFLSTDILGKRIDLLQKLAPATKTVSFLMDSGVLFQEDVTKEVVIAGRALGLDVEVVDVFSHPNLEATFARVAARGSGAVLVGPYLLFTGRNRVRILRLAALHRIPVCYANSTTVRDGGLMSYSAKPGQELPVVVNYVARILKGAKPADLPVQQPTKFELVINLKTAKALGLDVPDNLLALADEVIE